MKIAHRILFCCIAAFGFAVSAAAGQDLSRHVEVRGEWVYKDGEPFLVKGVGYSPYRPGQAPWTHKPDLAMMEQDFRRIREAGFNTLRTWAPLSAEALLLADAHGLMVLQGIWVERRADYASPAFQSAMLDIITQEVKKAGAHPNVLAVLAGNELFPDAVLKTGIGEVEALFGRISRAVKTADANRLVSYANWPILSFLGTAPWDLVCFNLYPYEPPSIAHTFGFRSYVEHLRQTVARGKPLVVSEVGLSVSPQKGGKQGYGGLSVEAQQQQLLQLWDALFQAGAQGGAVFEWNDEWWKPGDSPNDAAVHDPADAEEWFGLNEFSADGKTIVARPALAALSAYNQAILLSPVSGECYRDKIAVTVYATDRAAQVRVRLGKERWVSATKVNRHWWKVILPVKAGRSVASKPFVMEAYDGKKKLLIRQQRLIGLGQPVEPAQLRLETQRSIYDIGQRPEPVRWSVVVADASGKPLPRHPVRWSVVEPQSQLEHVQSALTDAQGKIEGSYLVQEPGLVLFSAATAREGADSPRWVGAEAVVTVRRQALHAHQPSAWEKGLPAVVRQVLAHTKPVFQLSDAGREPVVDYARYGVFHNAGKPDYRYEVTDGAGLAAAVGEGIYPNDSALANDPAYQVAKKEGKLAGSHWDFVFYRDPQLEFFRWAEAEEEPGVKQFYTALALEHAGLWAHAVKAYYTILVHFPDSVGWTGFDPPTPWYVAKVARDKIGAILRLHPELGLQLSGPRVIVENGFDNDTDNDNILVDPGKLVSVSPDAVNAAAADVAALPKRREVGKGLVRLVQYENGHWQLLVDGKPWAVHGMSYQPSAVGESPDEGTLKDWMVTDRNENGRIDAFDTFVDANRNNRQDADEPVVGDFALLKEMGVNTIRLYHHATGKALLRQLHAQYGLRFMIGDFVGMYTIGSGAKWEDGTDYLDAVQRKRMTESVRSMVREFKDEPYVLMWVLGNENNYGGVHGIVGGKGNAAQHPAEYYRFINELAAWIHQEDPNHPVAISNGDLGFLDVMAPLIPEVDIFGTNVYRGWHGFGSSLFEEVRRHLDRPVLITEYGCPAYQTGQPAEVAERDQAVYHLGNWVDLADNMAGRGQGNAIGGVVFEWNDEWWKGGQPPRFSPKVQETQPNWAGPFPGGWNFEEWYGLVSQGNGLLSPYLRQLRPSYHVYKVFWTASRQEDPL